MALEQSIFEEESIIQFVKSNWNIQCLSFKKCDLGTANCYFIYCEKDTYFLKEYQSDILESQAIKEAEILERLHEKKIPTTYFFKTQEDKYYVNYKEHFVVIEKYIRGESCGYNDFPQELLPSMAKMLANIHLALADMILPDSLDEVWVKEDALPKYTKLLELLDTNQLDPHYKQIKEDLLYKKSLLENQKKFRDYFKGITYCNSHGDYQGCQTIVYGDSINAVIDFTEACRLPVVWEIMRSFIQTSQDARKYNQIDIQGLCKYVKSYHQYVTLSENDIKGYALCVCISTITKYIWL